MADVEQQQIAVELRKFRKKLRQIEKLEELERDLTEEEVQKLSKKDEVRSKVQELVAIEDALKCELQNMESDTTQNEQGATEQEEQPRNENAQPVVQSNGEEEQELSSEVARNENELAINEVYDQAPERLHCPAVTVPDVVSTTQTRAQPLVSCDRTLMRFQVRSLEGHNDITCGIDCRGSVLVSGRGNYQVNSAFQRVMVWKRKCTGQQSPGQRSGLDSSMRRKKQRTGRDVCSRENGQLQGESSKSDRAVITEILDDEVVVDESQFERLRSETSRKTKKPRTKKEIWSREHGQLRGETCKRERGVMTDQLDNEIIVDENLLELFGSESNTRRRKQRTNKEMLSSGHGQLPRENNKSDGGLVTETLDDEVVIDKRQHQSLISESSVRTKKQRTDKETRSHEHGLPQGETSREGTVENVAGMVGDESRVTDLTLPSDQVHLASNSKGTLPSEHHQPETNKRTGVMTVNGSMVVNSENELVSSSSPVQLHRVSETKESLPCKHQELQEEACDQISAMAENGPGKMVVDQDEDPDLSLSLRKSSHVHLWSENKGALPNDHQLTVTSSPVAGCCSEIRLQTAVNGTAVESERALSSNRSGKCQPKSENKDTLAGQRQRLQEETVNEIFAEAENCDGRTAAEQSHDPDPRLSASTAGHPVHLRSENKELLLTDQRASVTESQNQNQQLDLLAGKPGQVHVTAENIEPSSSEYPELQEERSNQADQMTENHEEEVVMGQCKEPDPTLESNKSGQVHLKAENMKGSREEGLIVDQNKEPDPTVLSSKSGEAGMTDSGEARTAVNESQDVDPSQQPQEAISNQMAVITDNGDAGMAVDQIHDADLSQHPQTESSNQLVAMKESDAKIAADESQDVHPSEQPQTERSNQMAAMIGNGDIRMAVDESQDADPSHQPQAESSNQMAVMIVSGNVGMALGQMQDAKPGHQPQVETGNQMAVRIESDATMAVDESQDADPNQQPQAESSNQMAVMTVSGDAGMALGQMQNAEPSHKPQEETSNWIAVITDSGEVGMAIDESQDAYPSQQPQAESNNQSAAMTDNGVVRTSAMELIDERISDNKETLPDENQQPPAEASNHGAVSVENGWIRMSVKQRHFADSSQQLQAAASNQLAATTENGDARVAVNQMQDADLCQQPQVEGSHEIAAMAENGDERMAIGHSRDSGERMPSRKASHVHLKIGSKESWSSEHNIVVETIGQAAAVTENVENKVVDVHSLGQVFVDLKSLPDKHEGIGDTMLVGGKATRSHGQDSSTKWKTIKFYTRSLKGHTDLVRCVDCRDSVLLSGGRDTMLKLWDADTGREMRSMGGHTGTITSVYLVPNTDMSCRAVPSGFRPDQYSVLTGSRDCSMKIWSLTNGQMKRSMYAFSPVECLDCNTNNLTAAGLGGGKVELWDLESGYTVRSVRGHDEDTVTAIKFQGDRVISGSATGVVKVWDIRDNFLKPVMSSDETPVDSTAGNVTVKQRRVRCLATTQDTVYWGDDGVNMKAMDFKSGKLRKLRNHVTEFGSTGAMATSGSCLVSAGYDLDRGNGYLNVRSLPSEEYVATVDDESTGSITCLSCTQTTRDKVTLHRMCTGGLELKLWDQLPSSKVKKRSRPETDDGYVTAKHVRRYSLPDVSDTESSEDEDDQPEGDDSDDDDDASNTGSASRSWCTIS